MELQGGEVGLEKHTKPILNGMLRHSLVTLEGEKEFLVIYRALLPL